MRLYIPEIGDKLKLTNDWTFMLHWEHRNAGLIKHFFGEDYQWSREIKAARKVTLSAGTVLTVDRIYIRQGAAEYSSISFYAAVGETGKGSFGKPKSPRFWAKLEDCNKIEFDLKEVASTLKLVYDHNVPDIKHGEHYSNWGFKDFNISENRNESAFYEGTCFKVIDAGNKQPIFKVKVNANIEWKKGEHSAFMGFGTKTYWSGFFKNPKYTLLSLDGKEIGEWKTFASLKKNAKELAAAS